MCNAPCQLELSPCGMDTRPSIMYSPRHTYRPCVHTEYIMLGRLYISHYVFAAPYIEAVRNVLAAVHLGRVTKDKTNDRNVRQVVGVRCRLWPSLSSTQLNSTQPRHKGKKNDRTSHKRQTSRGVSSRSTQLNSTLRHRLFSFFSLLGARRSSKRAKGCRGKKDTPADLRR